SGGVYIRGAFAGTPLVNTAFLAIGAVLANLIGTTGASMLMIRPYMRANHVRQHQAHLVIFFIFIVSNTAGLLTPLGDPPLFLGIFITMIPALEILHARAIALNLREPWHYFWMSGILSSVLDNAPTYLTFTAMATGIAGGQAENLQSLLNSALGARLLAA